MTLKLRRYSLSSPRRSLRDLSSALIPGGGYTGIASQGFVHRLMNHGEKQYSDGKGNHINGLEGF